MTERDPDAEGEDREPTRPPRREPTLPADEEAAWAAIVAGYDQAPADRADAPGAPRTPAERDTTDPADTGRETSGPATAKAATDPADTGGETGTTGADAPTAEEGATGAPTGAEAPTGAKDGAPDAGENARTSASPSTSPAADGGSGPADTPKSDGGESAAEDDRVRNIGPPSVRGFTVLTLNATPAPGPRDWSPAEDDDEGHFVPPEPPPVPRGDATTTFAWIAALGGPLLLFGSIVFQVELVWWIVTLGVGGFLGGFGTLVARMRDGRDDDDWDDPGRGAVV
ncbi:hypothetical protein [Streptomyces sp. AJS327]|uniref:hypothetical protein n=1 Tax=Streptomyces sp. AJS327 TaxID=2545265 RepID=UPI0027E5865C|nr:hypothetical protein [Streptomyces sp. AJS327]